jgi:hypothetical protein
MACRRILSPQSARCYEMCVHTGPYGGQRQQPYPGRPTRQILNNEVVESTLTARQQAKGTMLRALLFGSLYHARLGTTQGRASIAVHWHCHHSCAVVITTRPHLVHASATRSRKANTKKLHGALILANFRSTRFGEIGRQGLCGPLLFS